MEVTLLIDVLVAGVVGAALGAFFFGGLHWTIERLARVRCPGLLLVGSFALRMTVLLSGVWLIGAGSWVRLLACMLGIVAGRMLTVRRATAEVRSC